MAVQKNFVIKNGLEVDTNLIVADSQTNKVGVGTTAPQYTLHVNGGIGATSLRVTGISTLNTLYTNTAYINSGIITATQLTSQNLNVTGISTLNNISLNGYVSIGGTTGVDGQVLVSTGVGVTWSKLTKDSVLSISSPGQDTFLFTYEIGTVEVYVNGIRLTANEFEAIDGSTIVLNDPCFGDEAVEIIANKIIPFGEPTPIGITVKDEGSTVGIANSITLINFIGSGVTVTSASAIGVDVTISNVSNPPGKTIYVAKNGNNSNDGLTLEYPKQTIEAAVGIAVTGDTVKVSPGTYIENNPIILSENVSIEGAELRNCIVTPQNPGLDLFLVSNGNHITDLSFQGQTATNNSAVIAFKPLVGVASNRFFDAARIIRYNLDFIASEAVGYLTSTDYRNPAFTLTAGISTVTSDIKDVYRALTHDIIRGGNSKCVGVGISYYGEYIVGIKTEIIDVLHYSAGIAQSCINNVSFAKTTGGNYQTEFTQIRDLSIQADPSTGSNIDIDSCSNVVSAIYSCVGVVTTIIGIGTTAVGTLFNLTYPGNAGIGTTNPNDVPSQGVGNVIKGPYIRNCTNFIPGSVGMRVDGFHADPGDKDDMGITGMMSVDSYTQYNQGGIGVEVSNGAYAQLVSIFTICTNKAIVTKGGGQCDITNSNSSFGTQGLVSDGVSDPTSLSSYRYTGEVASNASEGDSIITISGIGKERPYSGQALYFDELYYEIESVTIINGGSGFTEAPSVVFLGSPSGPSAIVAEATAEIEGGKVISISMIGNGRNYTLSDIAFGVTLSGGGGSGFNIVPNARPLYYQVRSATLPSAGISTVTLANPLNNDVGIGTTAFLFRQSLQIVSSHSFEYIGAGNSIEFARPSKGGVTIQENEVIKINGGEVVYTSTDQDGNFAIGDGLIIDQATGTIRGRSFERSLLNIVTPFIIALGAK
jgi:hypothetical protein